MGTFSYTVPVAGTDLNSVADPEISTALTTLQTWGNGNIDAVNLSSTLQAIVIPGSWTALSSSLTGTSGYFAPAARILGTTAQLSGAYNSGGGLSANGTVATLPSSAYYPASNVDISATFETNAGAVQAVILRIASASASIVTVAAIGGGGIISLDGLSYRLS